MYRIPALRLFNILVNRRSAAHEFIGNSFRTRARRVFEMFETTNLPTARGVWIPLFAKDSPTHHHFYFLISILPSAVLYD